MCIAVTSHRMMAGAAMAPERVTGRDGKTYPARKRRRSKPPRAERPLFAVFHTAVGAAVDVLDGDSAMLAAAIPLHEREQWASELRVLARLASFLAEQLAGGET
jgi:hypothetical protein